MGEKLDSFQESRARMNDRILETGTLETKRFFNLDSGVSYMMKTLLGFLFETTF